jgi:S-adenosylmethionine:tRNA ribosyltransferase-isomerase
LKFSEFDFSLPEELIAQTPAPNRDQSRLMIVYRKSGEIQMDIFANITQYLSEHPLMVFNDTKVVPAKLFGRPQNTDKQIEILLVREHQPLIWEVMIKGLGKFKPDTVFTFGDDMHKSILVEKKDGRGLMQFQSAKELALIIEQVGRPPLPPYIRRSLNDGNDLRRLDRERYQTVFAEKAGAIAAPTAGLHFTHALLETIKSQYADIASLTLHVGIGTFQSPRQDDVYQHQLNKEFFQISDDSWSKILNALHEKKKILAVGTTSTRVLETVGTNPSKILSGWTDRFIYPGQEFKIVNHLLTNFHLPKSTLYLLVCAFAGKSFMEKAYSIAIRHKFRFFSYGDAMLIL